MVALRFTSVQIICWHLIILYLVACFDRVEGNVSWFFEIELEKEWIMINNKRLLPVMRRAILSVSIGCAVFLTGCATIMSGTSQTVHVQVLSQSTHQLITDAKCNLTDAKGVTYVTSENPGSVYLPKVLGNLSVACSAKGYFQAHIATGSSFNAWTLGNILFWPGAIIDVATGAAEKYPSHITVLMSKHPVQHADKLLEPSS